MPYLSVNVAKALSAEEKQALQYELGTLITVIPGKSREVTMIDVKDGCALFMRGEPINGVFLDCRLYTPAPKASKALFTQKATAAFGSMLGVPAGDVYINYLEFSEWGAGGNLMG